MQYLPQFHRAPHEWRTRRIQKLVGDHMNPPLANRRYIPPARNAIRFSGVRFRASCSPGKDDDFRLSRRHLCVTDYFARWHNHLCACDLHQLRNPRRRADPRIRPSLTIHARPLTRRFLPDTAKCCAHSLNHAFAGPRPAHNARKQTNVCVDVRQYPRIHGQKIQRLLEQLRHSLLLVRHRADDQRWSQSQNLAHTIQVPAVTKLRQIRYRR